MMYKFTLFFCFAYFLFPEYLAVEFSSSFPLLTARRLLIILFFLIYIISNHGCIIKVNMPKKVKRFFIILIIVNIFHIVDVPSDAIKTIFSLVFEQMLLIVLLVNSLNTKARVERAVSCVVYCSGVICVLCIIESITGTNIFYSLNTVGRSMLQASYERLGIMRAEGPFGHPVYFAVYCASILPFSLYLYENKKKLVFLLIAFLNIVGAILSISRGQILVIFLALIYMFLKKNPSTKVKYLGIGFITLISILLASIAFPEILNIINSIINGTLSSLGFNIQVSNFGDNISGIDSRTGQLSGVLWTFMQNAWLIGFGPNAQTNGLVRYLTKWGWSVRKTFDVGYVGIFMQYGLIGSVGYFSIFSYFVRASRKRGDELKTNGLYSAFWYFTLIYLLCLMTTVGVDAVLFLILAFLVAYEKVDYQESGYVYKKGSFVDA